MMADDDWVIQGSRPPSVADSRPQTATFKPKGYHMINSESSVDETLFQSNYQGRLSGRINFQPPWDETKKFNSKKIIVMKKKKDRPLFWSPTPGSSCENFNVLKRGGGVRSEKFRPQKQRESFCDDSLFGKNNLQDPGFPAPWEKSVRNSAMYKDLNGNSNANNNNSNSNWNKIKLRHNTRPFSAPLNRDSSQKRPLWKQ